jgi:hypothetical protein
MPTVTEILKQEFRSPLQMLDKQRELLNITTPHVPLTVSAKPLVGTWINCDHDTRSLVRLMIAAKATEITVHAFGACHPDPCDWGVVEGKIYADNVTATPAVGFTAFYKFSFVETMVVANLRKGVLYVETFNHFIDKSGRADFYSLDMMSK